MIHETIGTPEIRELTVAVAVAEETEELNFSKDETVSLVLNDEYGVAISANVNGFEEGELFVGLKGYKKLGRFYTESGELIELGSDCKLTLGETVFEGEVKTVENKG